MLGSVLVGRSCSAGGAIRVQAAGATTSPREDIFLEGKRDVGPDPFTTVARVAVPSPASWRPQPAATTTASPVTTSTLVPGSTTTALFGGTGNQKVCDPEALIRYLEDNRDKAQASVDAH